MAPSFLPPIWKLCARSAAILLCVLVTAFLLSRAFPPPLLSDDGLGSFAVRTQIAGYMRSDGVYAKRVLLELPVGVCVVEQHPDSEISIVDFSAYREDDFAEIVFEKDNPWYSGQDVDRCSSSFNCCTFAVSRFLPLSTKDWVGTAPTFDGFFSPIAVIMDSYFQPVREFPMHSLTSIGDYETAVDLHDDDIVTFEYRSTEQGDLRRVFTHVGRVRRHNGVNRMLSKFGQGPIALSNLQFPLRMFPGTEVIKVYRYKFQPAVHSS